MTLQFFFFWEEKWQGTDSETENSRVKQKQKHQTPDPKRPAGRAQSRREGVISQEVTPEHLVSDYEKTNSEPRFISWIKEIIKKYKY